MVKRYTGSVWECETGNIKGFRSPTKFIVVWDEKEFAIRLKGAFFISGDLFNKKELKEMIRGIEQIELEKKQLNKRLN